MSLPNANKSEDTSFTDKANGGGTQKPNLSEVKNDQKAENTKKDQKAEKAEKDQKAENTKKDQEVEKDKSDGVPDLKKSPTATVAKKKTTPKLDVSGALFLYSEKTSLIKNHSGIIVIATLTKPVKTKKKIGFEIRYGAAFCSPDDTYDKKFGRELAKKRLQNDRLARTVFVTKKKFYRISQAIYADILASGTFPHWARLVVFKSLKKAMVEEEHIVAKSISDAACYRIIRMHRKIAGAMKFAKGSIIHPAFNIQDIRPPQIAGSLKINHDPTVIGIAKEQINTGELLQISHNGDIEAKK